MSRADPTAGPDHVLAILGCDLDPGVAYDMVDEVADLARREQRELKVLRATADGRHDLVRLGRAQHENNVWRRFLEGLQQRVLGARRQHVDLVEDVDLGAPRRPKSHLADQVAHGIDAIVRCGIEFMQVVTAASLEGQTRITFVTRLTTLQIRTVQRLGQDAGRRGLTRTPGPAERDTHGRRDHLRWRFAARLRHGLAQRMHPGIGRVGNADTAPHRPLFESLTALNRSARADVRRIR